MPIEFRQKYFVRIALGGNSYEMITYMTREAIWTELKRAQNDELLAHLDTITPDGEHKISLDLYIRDLQSVMHMEFIPNAPSPIVQPPRPRMM